MSLPAGTRLGPYEIVALLGAGGMGEVYRARDSRLQRDVALKVLAPDRAVDPDRIARFEREARAASALSHPAIVAVHDVGQADGTWYIAMELVDGATLRAQLTGRPMVARKLLTIALPIAEGLARAHRSAIVHRDLKPDNVMVSADGIVKIVDFGLAKLSQAFDEHAVTAPPGVVTMTASGMVVGTVGYMSPEQASGRDVDFRTDQFAFGTMLYEMATGCHPFARQTTAQTQAAIIEHEPAPIRSLNPAMPVPLVWIIERCLAKSPSERYAATDDLARDLAQVRDHLSDSDLVALTPVARRRGWVAPLALVGGALTLFAAGWMGSAWRSQTPEALPLWRQLTFRQGLVHTARFANDGRSVIYSAAWDGRPFEMYTTTVARPESAPLALPPAGLLAVSRRGEVALSLGCVWAAASGTCRGTLARAPLLGAAPREIVADVDSADWGPDDTLAVVRRVGNATQVEFPTGSIVASRGSGHVRVAPDGHRVAWTEFAQGGNVVMVRDQRGTRQISTGWQFISGLVWAPDGTALYVSGIHPGFDPESIVRVGLDGIERSYLRSTGRLRILDAAPTGSLLVDQGFGRNASFMRTGQPYGPPVPLSWFDGTFPDAVSADGTRFLFTERGSSALGREDLYPIYVRTTDGSAPVRLGSGYGLDISPDNRLALSRTRPRQDPAELVVHPLGPGDLRRLDHGGLDLVTENPRACFAGPARVVFNARLGNAWPRTYVQSVTSGPPAMLEHEPGAIVSPVSPDGTRFISERADHSLWAATLAPGAAVAVPFRLRANQILMQWTSDGRGIWVRTMEEARMVISRFELISGQETRLAEVFPQDRPSFRRWSGVQITPDGRTLIVGETATLSQLYLVEGVR